MAILYALLMALGLISRNPSTSNDYENAGLGNGGGASSITNGWDWTDNQRKNGWDWTDNQKKNGWDWTDNQ
ncbi:MAG: hypothetical protein ACKVPJ_09715 [Chitinophagales bacterium]